MTFFDTEKFIIEVENRPSLWDLSSSDYGNKVLKEKCWNEVATAMFHQFEMQQDQEKVKSVTDLKKKWRNIRNSFSREMRRIKTAPSGSGSSQTQKGYVYFDTLQFLIPVTSNPSTTSNIEEPSEEGLGSDSESTISGRGSGPLGADEISEPRKKRKSSNKSIINAEERFLIKMTKKLDTEEREDDDTRFLQSLHTHMKKIPEELKIDCQMEILGVIKKYQNPRISFPQSTVQFPPLVPPRNNPTGPPPAVFPPFFPIPGPGNIQYHPDHQPPLQQPTDQTTSQQQQQL